ncbi:MAG TPA: hypothetical protein VKT82_22125 [Ktedonobacterales bacterium]|nr:hypothetical protein [Ktedonobacterales bacterium]
MSSSQLAYENPETTYAQLNQQQQATLAQEFIRGFQKVENPHEDEFASIDPKKVTPQQLAAMHQHAREAHPDVLGRVMRHPIVAALLGGFGAYEIDKHVINRAVH